MYRVMMMVMLKDMWRYMKKEKFALLWYMLIVAIAFQNMAVLLDMDVRQMISAGIQMQCIYARQEKKRRNDIYSGC